MSVNKCLSSLKPLLKVLYICNIVIVLPWSLCHLEPEYMKYLLVTRVDQYFLPALFAGPGLWSIYLYVLVLAHH